MDAWVRLTFRDTGVGMDAETQALIFEPFFTTRPPGEGTGLGLATVSNIVQQSGGVIEVDSEPGQGTRFRIHLPRVDEQPEPPQCPLLHSRGREGHETLLLVEDQDPLRDMICEALRLLGYRVLVAPDGEAAIEVARRHRGRSGPARDRRRHAPAGRLGSGAAPPLEAPRHPCALHVRPRARRRHPPGTRRPGWCSREALQHQGPFAEGSPGARPTRSRDISAPGFPDTSPSRARRRRRPSAGCTRRAGWRCSPTPDRWAGTRGFRRWRPRVSTVSRSGTRATTPGGGKPTSVWPRGWIWPHREVPIIMGTASAMPAWGKNPSPRRPSSGFAAAVPAREPLWGRGGEDGGSSDRGRTGHSPRSEPEYDRG